MTADTEKTGSTPRPFAQSRAEMDAMLAKVTPEPWTADEFCMEEDRAVRVGTTDGGPTYYHNSATICECATNHEERAPHEPLIGVVQAERNAAFIATARSYIPECHAEIDRLTHAHTSSKALIEELTGALEWIEQTDRQWVAAVTNPEWIIERRDQEKYANHILIYGPAGWRARAALLAATPKGGA